MGNFYVNITTRKAPTDEIVSLLKTKGLAAFIINGPDDYCTIYEEGCDAQDTEHLSSLLSDISTRFSCPAFGILNHDDDILAYELWSNGELVDAYDSCPGYFDGDESRMVPEGGDAKALSELMGNGQNIEEIEKTLRSSGDDEDYAFAVERHEALAKAVGLPSHTVGCGYGYISEGEIPEGIASQDIIRTDG